MSVRHRAPRYKFVDGTWEAYRKHYISTPIYGELLTYSNITYLSPRITLASLTF